MTDAGKIALVGAGILALMDYQARRNPPKVFFQKTMRGNMNGRCLPPFGIFIDEKQKGNRALLEHEMRHWKQYQRLGLLVFYIRAICENLKYGYDKMPLEIEARQNESPYCQTNYIECVRNGRSKTVFNPVFRKK